MKSYSLGKFDSVQVDSLIDETSALTDDAYSSAYQEYSIGLWDTATLWNEAGNESGDVPEHASIAVPTFVGASTPTVNEFVRSQFHVGALRAVRLFRARQGAIIIPHRDYLEHSNGFCRMHIPLLTTPGARNSENNEIYRMLPGELWFLDSNEVHSGGVLDSGTRIHLVLDFTYDHSETPASVLKQADLLRPVTRNAQIPRPELDRDALESLLGGGGVVTLAMWPALVQMLARIHLTSDVHPAELYDWLDELAARSGNRELVAEARRMRRYFLTDGISKTPSFERFWRDLDAAREKELVA